MDRSHQPAKFGGHWQCGSGDVMPLVCHLILQDHVTKGWRNFMHGSQLSHHPAKLGGIGTVVMEI